MALSEVLVLRRTTGEELSIMAIWHGFLRTEGPAGPRGRHPAQTSLALTRRRRGRRRPRRSRTRT
eukprot:10807279-Lingulodinium_polyedra.AAC.1